MLQGYHFKCLLCRHVSKYFKNKYEVRRHLQDQHSGVGYQCTVCGLLFHRRNTKHACDGTERDMEYIHRETGVWGEEARLKLVEFIEGKQDRFWQYVEIEEPESLRSVVVKTNDVARKPRPRKESPRPRQEPSGATTPMSWDEPEPIELGEPPRKKERKETVGPDLSCSSSSSSSSSSEESADSSDSESDSDYEPPVKRAKTGKLRDKKHEIGQKEREKDKRKVTLTQNNKKDNGTKTQNKDELSKDSVIRIQNKNETKKSNMKKTQNKNETNNVSETEKDNVKQTLKKDETKKDNVKKTQNKNESETKKDNVKQTLNKDEIKKDNVKKTQNKNESETKKDNVKQTLNKDEIKKDNMTKTQNNEETKKGSVANKECRNDVQNEKDMDVVEKSGNENECRVTENKKDGENSGNGELVKETESEGEKRVKNKNGTNVDKNSTKDSRSKVGEEKDLKKSKHNVLSDGSNQIQKEKRQNREMGEEQDKHREKFEKLTETQKNKNAKVLSLNINENGVENEINIKDGKEKQNGAERLLENNKKDGAHPQKENLKNKEKDIEESNMTDKQNEIVVLDQNQNNNLNGPDAQTDLVTTQETQTKTIKHKETYKEKKSETKEKKDKAKQADKESQKKITLKEYEARKLTGGHTEQIVEIHKIGEAIREGNSECVVMGGGQILDTIMQDISNTFCTQQPATPVRDCTSNQQIETPYSDYRMMEIQYRSYEEIETRFDTDEISGAEVQQDDQEILNAVASITVQSTEEDNSFTIMRDCVMELAEEAVLDQEIDGAIESVCIEMMEEQRLRKEEKRKKKADKRKYVEAGMEHASGLLSNVGTVNDEPDVGDDEDIEYIRKIQGCKVVLNVGGARFETSILTLQKEPKSLLAKLFTKESSIIPQGNSIFLDRDASHFKVILNYLRYDGDINPAVLPKERRYLLELQKECEYYRLKGLKKLVKKRLKQLTNLYGTDYCC